MDVKLQIIGLRKLSGGNSSVGRAQASQAWGREFEPRFPLHFLDWLYEKSFCIVSVSRDFLTLLKETNNEKLFIKRASSVFQVP